MTKPHQPPVYKDKTVKGRAMLVCETHGTVVPARDYKHADEAVLNSWIFCDGCWREKNGNGKG